MFSSLIERVTRNLVRRGIRDGLMAGNGFWLAAGAVAWLVRFLRKRPTASIVTETIRPGESILVTSVAAPPFGRRARKLARTERKDAAAERSQIRRERKHAAERALPAASDGA